MTIPPGFKASIGRVSDMVREAFPFIRNRLSPDEQTLAIFLRGNGELYKALVNLIQSRIEGRARMPVPSNPIECLASMSRDKELRWLLSRLDSIHRSPAEPAQDGEQPV